MIEIQLTLGGEWLPLFVGIENGSEDRISASRRILNGGLFGIRLCYAGGIRVNTEALPDSYAWKAWRYGSDKQFAWQSGTMGAPAFADL